MSAPSTAGRWVAEFLLIVMGVLAAFAVENWRQTRSDSATEQLLLMGIAADLTRDVGDLEVAIVSAQARMAATDDLLRLIGDPDTAMLSVAIPENPPAGLIQADERRLLDDARVRYPARSFGAQQALMLAGHMLLLDVSDATYREARDNGQLDLVEDAELRSAIAARYASVLRVHTIEERLGAAVPRFVSSLEEAGLSGAGGASDTQVAAVLRQNPNLVAGLKNVRYPAARMMGAYVGTLTSTSVLLEEVSDAIEEGRAAR